MSHTIAIRVSRFLEKAGHLVRDAEAEYLDLVQDEDAMGAIVGASITYRLAFGPNAGRKALTLQTVPVRTEQRKGDDLVTKQAGFSLHAGIACKSHQRKKLERLCRYITRPAIADRRLSLANNGNVVIAPYDDGTTGTLYRGLNRVRSAVVRGSRHNAATLNYALQPTRGLPCTSISCWSAMQRDSI